MTTKARQRANAELTKLHELVGSPGHEELMRQRARVNGPFISRATYYSVLSGKASLLQERRAAFIALCLAYARAHRPMSRLTTEQEDAGYWHDRCDAVMGLAVARSGKYVGTRLAQHKAWGYVRTDGVEPLREDAVEVAYRLVTLQQTAESVLGGGDPWHDPGFTDRMSERIAGLVSRLEDPALSAAEAAVLVLAPLAFQVDVSLRTARMIDVRPADLDGETRSPGNRGDYLSFLTPEPYRRLVGRACGAGPGSQASVEIGWWLYHRWLDVKHSTDSVFHALLDDPVIKASPTRRILVELLDGIMRAIRTSPEQLRKLELLGLDAGPGASSMTPPPLVMRKQLVALLVRLAYALAVPITALPAVIVEHLGIRDRVDLEELRETLRLSSWDDTTLTASCRHPAVLVALQDHAAHVDAVLRSISAVAADSKALQSLRRLPAAGASADKVVAAPNSAGRPLFTTPVDRFRLDQDRVRELLMDRNLYRDPALAIRELYQNALDACRLRDARQRCRDKEEGTDLGWTGDITFVQGIERGRHYLECRDNGVGMGEADLRGAFSHLGVRFVDRPEYLYDDMQFRRHGVEFVPNSRFGIGVISYFMLADEIEVETCRMGYPGQDTGPLCTVTIEGPGHLFRIKEQMTPDRKPGTKVRLYLKDGERAPSCVDLLRKVLGIAAFRTVAEHDDQRDVWEPDTFHSRQRPAFDQHGIDAFGRTIPCTEQHDGRVIWCEHGGALLVDGIYVRAGDRQGGLGRPDEDDDLRGAVVNLTGNPPAALSVDRSLVLDDVSQRVQRLMTDAVHELVTDPPAFLRTEWIHDVAQSSPWVADLVTSAATASGTLLPLGNDKTFGSAVAGCFPPDLDFLQPGRDDTHDWTHGGRQQDRHTYDGPLPILDTDRFPDHIALWRWLARQPAEAVDQLTDIPPDLVARIDILPALPSDAVLLANTTDWSRDDVLGADAPPPPGHLLWVAAATGASPREAAERALALGMREVAPDTFSADIRLETAELALLSVHLDGKAPWLTTDEPVRITHFLDARRILRLGVAESANRLRRYGFKVPSDAHLSYLSQCRGDQIKLLSRNLDGEAPWIRYDPHVAFAHLVKASLKLDYDTDEAARHLDRLGIRVAVPADQPPRPTADDLRLISRDFDENDPWLDYDQPVPPRHLIKAAPTVGGPRKAAERLSALGFTVMALDRIPANQLDDLDEEIGRQDRTGTDDAFEVTKPVQATQLFWISTQVPEFSVRDVARRLGSYGFEVGDDAIALAEKLTAANLKLLSQDHDEVPPWLDLTETVPAAHLIRPSLEGDGSPHHLIEQLGEWEVDITVPCGFPSQLTPTDRKLVHDPRLNHWLAVEKRLSLSDLIMAARRASIPVRDAAWRLRELGFEVPDVADTIRRAHARVPRR